MKEVCKRKKEGEIRESTEGETEGIEKEGELYIGR